MTVQLDDLARELTDLSDALDLGAWLPGPAGRSCAERVVGALAERELPEAIVHGLTETAHALRKDGDERFGAALTTCAALCRRSPEAATPEGRRVLGQAVGLVRRVAAGQR
ncbi:hypothetical protein ACIO3O_03395 [Streptomyces sp. NPDC087440]|uniref:hypothetical protein n=1 Tax=Streptomyces sp. NPDC087440 TaxID=3365790 RepID=UPI0037FB69AC